MHHITSYRAALCATAAALACTGSGALAQTGNAIGFGLDAESAAVEIAAADALFALASVSQPVVLNENVLDDDGALLEDGDETSEEDADDRPITLMGGTVNPFGGTIDPFGGTIDPFGGTIDPFGGTINPFGGTIDPFGGTINPFHGEVRLLWGTIDPFGGTIDPFGGTIDPFGGTIDPFGGTIDPFYGQIDPYKGNIDPFTGVELPSYVETNAFWHEFGAEWRRMNVLLLDIQNNGDTRAKRAELGALLGGIVARSGQVWGEAVAARSGKTFDEAFVNPLLIKYGITGDQVQAFLNLSMSQRAQLVTEWFDGLMEYTGYDHIDHWMHAINWNPTLTMEQGSGADSIIGILDSSIANDTEIAGNVFHSGGYAATVGGHGSGVASLLVAAHDGRGIMGIAPAASVASYNPFDHTGTASWDDITTGITVLKQHGASVINMSLGITGWTLHPEWNNVFQNQGVQAVIDDTLFVIAAGNDGSTQTANMDWTQDRNFGLLVVGSIDPNGKISSFSNRPGSACFMTAGVCDGYLRDRFIVAPGEFILMSDGEGGLVRRSGTSFAAPLVSGAITLLHDRWPWLVQHPDAAATIILGTARDLGEPGVDDVYGVGLLDVQASQSPLDFNNVEFHQRSRGSVVSLRRAANDVLSGGIGASWETNGVYMAVFENVGSTYRDFLIPLSGQLVGQKTQASKSLEYFQSYIRGRFVKWVNSKGANSSGGRFTDLATITTPDTGGWRYSVSASNPVNYLVGSGRAQVPHSAMSLTSPDGTMSLTTGYGHGAMTLVGQEAFGLTTDYSAQGGGVNPLLGLASGGGFFDAQYALDSRTTIGFGLTGRTLDHSENDQLTAAERTQLRDVEDYRASAWNLRLTHRPADAITLSVSAASLDEANGLLGVQSVIEGDLDDGSRSTTLTLGSSFDLPEGITLAATATAGRTRSPGSDVQNITTTGAGVVSSAYAVSASKLGIFGKEDRLRVSLAQPLHIERGDLKYTSIEVVDRTTGELGEVTQTFDIADNRRRYIGEVIYSSPLIGSGEFAFFGRGEYDPAKTNGGNQFIVGGMLNLQF